MLTLLGRLTQTSVLIHPGMGPGAVYKRIKYFARGVAFASATAEWFHLLETPGLAAVVRHDPRLFQKLQRPYLVRNFGTGRRLNALRHHYQFVLDRFSSELRREIFSHPGKSLGRLPANDGQGYDLRLNYSRHEKEGELSISLVSNETGLALSTLTFSIAPFADQGGEIIIGGLQGNKLAGNRELIVGLTRSWHGLRPKALLLFALQQLAAIWGITRVRAVGNEMQVCGHWRIRKSVAFSYDEWWLEIDGRLGQDGLFELPARFVPREMATLKANKRQQYRRRYAMLANLSGQIAVNLGVSKATQRDLVPAWEPEVRELNGALAG